MRAGGALQYVLLQITRHGYVASPLTQIREDPDTRSQLPTLLEDTLSLSMIPHILLRAGQGPPAGTLHRPIINVLTELD